MANKNIISNTLKILILLSGIVLFVIQIRVVWDNYVAERKAFGTSKDIKKKIPIPPIALCPEIIDVKMSMTDPDLFVDQFYKLNDNIRIQIMYDIYHEKNLQLGMNFDEQGVLLVTLKELWHPDMGLCYVLVPNSTRLEFGLADFMFINIFLNERKGDAVKVMLHNEENIEFLNFIDFGRQAPTFSVLEGGTRMGMNIRKSVLRYMVLKGKLQISQLDFVPSPKSY